MRLPQTKKILKEDIKSELRSGVSPIIEAFNSFAESVYQALNKSITFNENIASFIKEVTYNTTSSYPTMDPIQFTNELKTKAIGIIPLQVINRADYTSPAGPVYIPWTENSGIISVESITGLVASKSYTVRMLII